MASQQHVLITGCSDNSIGSALALAFQKRGLHVFAAARSVSKMSQLQDVANITLLALDVTSADSISSALEFVSAKTGGKLDYLVNNSGRGYVMPILDTDLEEAKKMYEVNLWGLLAVTKAFAPLVIEAKGCIVNNSSVAGESSPPYHALYSGSKAAVTTISEALRIELYPFGVRVAILMTGAVSTTFQEHLPAFKLPESSRYFTFEEVIRKQTTKEYIPRTISAQTYATRVVGDLLSGKGGKIWRGAFATFARFFMPLAPTWLINKLYRRRGGLDRRL